MDFKKLKKNLLKGMLRGLGKLPLKFHYFWSGVMAWILSNIVHYRKEVIIANIARSFPTMPYAEIRKTVKGFYRHLGEIIAEAIWYGASDYKRLHETGICRITNLEVLNEAYVNSPSITILGSHCGNWELIGGFWGYNYNENVGYPDTEDCIVVAYKQLHNEVWDEIMKENRCAPLKDFHGMVETNSILRYSLKNRDKKKVYIYYTDQFPYASRYDIGTFLNQKTTAMIGGAALAHKLGMSVLYLKMKRVERGHYDITLIPICMDASKMAPEEILRKYFDMLEDEIREDPSNWLWSHKRWKD